MSAELAIEFSSLGRSFKGCFTWENSPPREFHTGMTFWFSMAFTWYWVISYLGYLKVHFMLIKCICDSKSQTLRMRYPFQSTGRPISHRNGWSFRIYMILFRDFVPEILAPVQQPGWTHAGVTRAGMTFCSGITVTNVEPCRGNRSELG